MSRLNELLSEIQALQERVTEEVSKEADELGYSIKRGRVNFKNEVKQRHRELTKKIKDYFAECTWLGLLVSPIVYSLIIPVVLFDIFIFFYQLICFTVYGIPKVRRRNYVVVDRHKLQYLNIIERFNCVYCGYTNGFLSYAQEVAARSEQYWCPIKHARKLEAAHSRYYDFLPYGDADAYVNELDKLKKKLRDSE